MILDTIRDLEIGDEMRGENQYTRKELHLIPGGWLKLGPSINLKVFKKYKQATCLNKELDGKLSLLFASGFSHFFPTQQHLVDLKKSLIQEHIGEKKFRISTKFEPVKNHEEGLRS